MNLNWSYGQETAKLGSDLRYLDLWPLTLTFCMDVTSVIGNNSWKFHDDTMMGTWSKRCDKQTDGQTDRQTDWTIHRAAWSQLKMHLKMSSGKCQPYCLGLNVLKHWSLIKTISILQTALAKRFHEWFFSYNFELWNMFQRELTISQH